MIVRSFNPRDAEALAEVYRDAVRGVGPQAYPAEQIAAWASYPENMAEFRDRMSRWLTLVAEEGARVIAFGQLDPDDHLAFLYCLAAHARRGVGSKIYSALEAHAFARGVLEIRTEANRISRRFFEKQGFAVVAIERIRRFGLEFERFRMRKKRNA